MFIKGILSFILGHLLFLGGNNTSVYVAPPALPKTQVATTTIKTDTGINEVTQKIKTEVPIKKAEVKPKENPKEEVPKPVTPPTPLPDFEKVNTFARKAIVNILCSTKGGELSPISGTGVVISSKGVILTNAHIGQYFLLKDFKQKDYVGCVIRTGSPAYPEYKVELMYISPTWIGQNRRILKEEVPKGTGENDFAFLRITGKIDGSKLPESFSYVIPNIRESIDLDEPVLLVSYPAGFLGGLSILQDLNVTSSITTVQDIFTFKENTIDLISVPGTVVSQRGSSGGAVVDKYISLLGVISTSSEGNSTDKRDLRAITVAHINRSLQKEIGLNLNTFLSQDSENFAKTFASTTAPVLSKLIIDDLLK